MRLSWRQILYGMPVVGIQMVLAAVWFIPPCAGLHGGTCNNNFAYETTVLGLTLFGVVGPAALVVFAVSHFSQARRRTRANEEL